MTDSDPKPIGPDEISALSRVARLDLSDERKNAVAPALDGVLQLCDALDSIDVGETPPTNAFDPRWRGRP